MGYRGKHRINPADTVRMLTATALVLLMTLSALALFYGGLVQAKNTLSVLVQCAAWSPPSVRCCGTRCAIYIGLWRRPGRLAGRWRRFLPGRDLAERRACRHPHSRKRLCHVPDDFRGHHPGPDHRRLCRAHSLRRGSPDFDFVAPDRLCAGGALGLGRWLAGQARGNGFCRRHRGACHRRRLRPGDRLDDPAAA